MSRYDHLEPVVKIQEKEPNIHVRVKCFILDLHVQGEEQTLLTAHLPVLFPYHFLVVNWMFY